MKGVEIKMNLVASTNTSEKESLNLSDFEQNKQILRPTKYPTIICKDCKRRYIDTLGLEIFVICHCKCHQCSPFKKIYSIWQYKADFYDNNYLNKGGLQ
jgi:hypothetical protein